MRPALLKVLGKRHRVLWDCRDLDEDTGRIRHAENTILVSADLGVDEARETLLHELIHGVENQLGISVGENKVRALSVGIFAVMRENPGLANFIFGDSDGDV